MQSRMKKWMVGSAMVGVLAAGAVTGSGVLAVEGTPEAHSAASAEDRAARRAEAYDAFIGLLAGNLGVDEATADSALRQTLMDLIDQGVADGVLTREQGDQMKSEIESADFTPNVRGLLRGDRPMEDRTRGGHGHGDGDDKGRDDEHATGEAGGNVDEATPSPGSTAVSG